MGLAPILVAQIFEVVKGLKALDVTVLLVEQNAFGALKVADRGYVMETGRITMTGAAAELDRRPAHPRSLPGDLSMAVSIERDGRVAVVTIDNPPVNALGQALRQGPVGRGRDPRRRPGGRGRRPALRRRTFIAGADVTEFGKPPVPPHLPDLVARIEGCGEALGRRHPRLRPRRRLRDRARLPLPGGRWPAPRSACPRSRSASCPAPAAPSACRGSSAPERGRRAGHHRQAGEAPKALAIGLVDAVVDGDLRAGAVAFARDAVARPLPAPLRDRPRTLPPPASGRRPRPPCANGARGEVAPLRALACLRRAVEGDFDAAMAFERETFLDLRASPQAAALRHVFFAERAAPRPAALKGVEPRPVRSAAVIGGGTMGAGIAAALRDAGLPVTLVERDAEALERGLANLRGIFDGAVRRGRLTAEAPPPAWPA